MVRGSWFCLYQLLFQTCDSCLHGFPWHCHSGPDFDGPGSVSFWRRCPHNVWQGHSLPYHKFAVRAEPQGSLTTLFCLSANYKVNGMENRQLSVIMVTSLSLPPVVYKRAQVRGVQQKGLLSFIWQQTHWYYPVLERRPALWTVHPTRPFQHWTVPPSGAPYQQMPSEQIRQATLAAPTARGGQKTHWVAHPNQELPCPVNKTPLGLARDPPTDQHTRYASRVYQGIIPKRRDEGQLEDARKNQRKTGDTRGEAAVHGGANSHRRGVHHCGGPKGAFPPPNKESASSPWEPGGQAFCRPWPHTHRPYYVHGVWGGNKEEADVPSDGD